MTCDHAPQWQRYLVGGAVRDRLMGRVAGDRDWVIVGAHPDALMAAGYLPVGRDFPVFLDPITRDEVALARTERKVAAGYHGFQFQADPSVTLEADLQRRDLTINAMAEAPDGTVLDPYGGQQDLRARILRHVSPAFAEDPVRILRLARFAARWPEFHVAPETMRLCQRMVQAGEVDALVPERVWQEWSRGLMESRPDRMLEVLMQCGALARLLPSVAQAWSDAATARQVTAALLEGISRGWDIALRNAVVLQSATPAETKHGAIGESALRMPAECLDLLTATVRERQALERLAQADAETIGRWLQAQDAWRRPERVEALIEVLQVLAPATQRSAAKRLHRSLQAALALDTSAIVRRAQAEGNRGPALGAAVFAARCAAIATVG